MAKAKPSAVVQLGVQVAEESVVASALPHRPTPVVIFNDWSLSVEDIDTPPLAVVRFQIGNSIYDVRPEDFNGLLTTLQRLVQMARNREAARPGFHAYERPA